MVGALEDLFDYIDGLELLSEGGTSTTYQETFTDGGVFSVTGAGLDSNLWHIVTMTYTEPANQVSASIAADLLLNLDTDALHGNLSSANFKLFDIELSGLGTMYLDSSGSGSGTWRELVYTASGLTTRIEDAAITYDGYQASGTIGKATLVSSNGEWISISNSSKLTAPFLNGLLGTNWSHFLSGAFLDGNDHLTGRNRDDSFGGFEGDDVLTGQGGDDTLDGGAGSDTLDGGAGTDTASYTGAVAAVSVTLATPGVQQNTLGAGLDTLIGIEKLSGSAFNDSLSGDANGNSLTGAAGNDTLDGGGGDDSLNGGDGDDTLLFDASDGSVDGGAGTDVGVFSGASTAQARAFAMAAHSLERLQWTVAGNTWTLVLNGDGSRTETVSDTAASESGFASRTTRLAVSGAVDWIDTLADNGVRTYNDLDDLGDQAWTQLFQVYDGSGLVDFRDYRNDDGTRLVIDDDNLGNQGWTQIQQKYDTQDREDYRDYRLDDGRRQVVDYDQASDQNFVRLDQLYDALGREDYRDYRLDDGRRQLVDYDQANNQSWSEVIQLYDAQAREDYRDYRLDDGRRQLVDYDQANNQAWSRSTQLYDPLDRQDYRDYAMDDGSRTFIDYDQAGQFAWTEWQKEFDAAGTLLHQRITYDSGDIVYQ